MDTTALAPVPATETSRWDTLAPLSGIAVVVCAIGAVLVHDVIGDTPGADAPAADFVRYYQEEDGTIWGAGIFVSLAAVSLFWFVGSLRAAIHAAEGGVGRLAATAQGGGIALAALLLASFGSQVSAAVLVSDRDAPIGGDVAVGYWYAGDGLFLATAYAAAVLVLATGVAAIRHGVLPRWLGWASVALAVLLLVPWVNWAGVAFLLPVWLVATSLLLWRSAAAASRT